MDPILLFALFMAGGTLALAYNEIQTKRFLNDNVDEQVVVTLLFIGSGLVLAPLLLVFGIPAIARGFWPALGGTMVINVIAQNLFARAYKLSDVSLISPLRLLTPILILGTGFLLLQETPTVNGILGIFITIAGFYLLLFSGWKLRAVGRGVWYGLAGSALFAISFPLDKIIVTRSSTLFAVTLNVVGIGVITFLLNVFFDRSFARRFFRKLCETPYAYLRLSLVGASGYFLANHALIYAPVSVASNFKRIQALWTVVLAGTLLKEKDIVRKLFAVALILVGILISLVSG